MSLVLGALAGAGGQLADFADKQMAQDQALERMNTESTLAQNRAQALEVFKQTLQNAPLVRLGAKAQDLAQQDVPQEPANVTALSGQGSGGPANFVGNPGIVRSAIQNSTTMTAQEKADALAELQQQLSTDQQTAADAVAGKTRKRTSDEALAAAVDDAKVNDLPAYAQYEKDIGKPKRDERRIDVLQQKEDNRADAVIAAEKRRADAEQRRFMLDTAKLDLQQGNQDLQNRKIDALIDHWERGDDRKDQPKPATAERMTTIVNAMNNSIRNLDDNKPSKDAPADQQTEWQNQRTNAFAVRARAMARLNANFDDTATQDPSVPGAPNPAASAIPALPAGSKQIGTSGGKPVYQTPDGKRFIAQ